MIRTTLFSSTAFLMSNLTAYAADKMAPLEWERLEDPAYEEALYAKIEAAAHDVCKEEVRGAAFYHSEMEYCIKRSIEDAVEQADHPMLTAFFEGAPEIGSVAAR